MNLAELRASMMNILDRDDCTTALANTFIGQALQRIQRAVRLPSMERLFVVSVGANDAPVTYIQIPPDLLEIIDVFVVAPDGMNVTPLRHASFRQLTALSPRLTVPEAYARLQATLQIRGSVQPGSTIQLLYYGEMEALSADSDTNELSVSQPDVIVYGALSLAGDHFVHPKMSDWESRFQSYVGDLQQMANDLENSGGPASVALCQGDV